MVPAAFSGCFTDKSDSADLAGGIPFIAQEPALLELKECARFFTNSESWAASIEVRSGGIEKERVVRKGRLIISNTRLQVEVEHSNPGKTALSHPSAITALVWDEAKRSGLALSDDLQGYCPLLPSESFTNLPTANPQPIVESGNHQTLEAFQDNKNIVRIFRKDPGSLFAAIVEVENFQGLSRILIGPPVFRKVPESEFLSERGMTAYPSPVAMENELFQRLGDLRGNTARTIENGPAYRQETPP